VCSSDLETSKELAKLLGFRLVDKHIIDERISASGIQGGKLRKYDEKRPGLFASFSQDRDEYFHYLKKALLEEAAAGDCVIVGRGAFSIFSSLPGLLSVFLVSPPELRRKRVESYFQCAEKKAQQILAQSDDDRTGFHKYFFDCDWKNPENYSITLNTGFHSPVDCAAIIKQAFDQIQTDDVKNTYSKRLEELLLGQDIVHRILFDKHIAVRFFDVSVNENEVTLFGVASSVAVVEACAASVNEVSGKFKVSSNIQVVQEYEAGAAYEVGSFK
jgi:cytidylate kinase